MNQRGIVFSNKIELRLIFLVYFLLLFGAIWHLTNMFAELMQETTSLMMMSIGVLALLSVEKSKIIKVSMWFGLTAVSTFIIEYIGVKTGLVFGFYSYSDYLTLQVVGVPIAIGISWAGSCLAAFGIVQRVSFFNNKSQLVKAILIGFLMMVFDVFLEPVAIKLNYWSWVDSFPPLQNFIAWWIIGTLFSFILLKLIPDIKLSQLSIHLFFSQVLYFSLILLAL